AVKLGFRAIINREFDSLSLTKRVTILGFKDQPEFINRLRSPYLEDLPYYNDIIKAAAEAIEAYD
ncbi:hypothetical protein LX32DRAFT_642513, partial [Colletotrichum zoysiae]